MKTVSKAYLMGIKEGRAFLTNNPDLTTEEMQRCLSQCKRLARDFSDDLKDMFKGEAAFWKHQIAVKEKANNPCVSASATV